MTDPATHLLERVLSRLETHGWYQGNYTPHEHDRYVNPPTCLLGALYAENGELTEFNASDLVAASFSTAPELHDAIERLAASVDVAPVLNEGAIISFNDERGREFSDIRDALKRAIDA